MYIVGFFHKFRESFMMSILSEKLLVYVYVLCDLGGMAQSIRREKILRQCLFREIYQKFAPQ